MNALQIFNYQDKEVRTVTINNEPWFVAKDVCEILDVGNTAQALTRLDEDEKGIISNDTLGGNQEMSVVNEPGLYALVLGSKKPEAKVFKRWITHEVIPSIRKTGGYIPAAPEDTEAEILAKAVLIANKTIADQKQRLGQLEVVNSKLTVENTIMQPKAEYFDELVDRNLLTSFRETAKELKVKESVLIDFLLEHKYIFRNKKGKLEPYAQYAKSDLFEIKECFNEKTQWRGQQTLITPKGRETFRLLLVGLKTA